MAERIIVAGVRGSDEQSHDADFDSIPIAPHGDFAADDPRRTENALAVY